MPTSPPQHRFCCVTRRVFESTSTRSIAAGLSAFAPDSVAFAAGRVMLARIDELARQRISFGFETTLASRSFAPWLRLRLAGGYAVHLLFLWLASPELALALVARRVELGGHSVPDDVIRRRYTAGVVELLRAVPADRLDLAGLR